MTEEILEDLKPMENKSRLFSRLSFLNAFILSIIFLYFLSFTNKIKPSSTVVITSPSIVIIIVFLILLLTGIGLVIISFARKEKSTVLKWIGCLLNILYLLLSIGSIIYASTIDSM